jgi:predicted permease
VLLAGAGAALGLLIGFWATRTLSAQMAAALPLQVTFSGAPDSRVLLATMLFAALATIASGLGPALRLSRRDLVNDLKDRSSEGAATGRRFGARNLMVIGQVSLSLALLTAGGIFTKTAIAASQVNPGHSYAHLLVANLDGSIGGYTQAATRASYRNILDRLRRTPGIVSASMASSMAFGDTHEGETIERVGVKDSAANVRELRIVGARYFETLGVAMVRGREFTIAEEESPDAPRVTIIDEVLARELFGDANPIGEMVRATPEAGRPPSGREQPMEVIGIAPPMRAEVLQAGSVSHMYVPYARNYRASMFVQVRTAPGIEADAAIDLVRAEVRAADAAVPMLSLMTMQAFHDSGLELLALKGGAWLFSLLGAVALLLSVVGVYGVKSYIVSQRTREIGIRMALGADARAVLGMMLRDGMFLTGAGVAIGVPLAVGVSLVMASVFVDVGGLDAIVIGTSTVALGAAATIATLIPSRRASKIEPLTALRAE